MCIRDSSDDLFSAWLRFAGGATGTIDVSMVEREREHRVTVAGSAGALRIEEQAASRLARGDEAWEEIAADDPLPESARLGIPETDWARAFLLFAREIARAIEEGRAEVPGASTFEDGHRNQLVLDAIRRSSEGGRWEPVGPAGRLDPANGLDPADGPDPAGLPRA
ncbi:MAG: Gfo/Idh/MocA family oxidoreductase [Candidatus Eisenbacteria bacterium]|nr:Gfo/Idh/MocA family oxidoreductase [Candidatus Eisenbacteria bacterium]